MISFLAARFSAAFLTRTTTTANTQHDTTSPMPPSDAHRAITLSFPSLLSSLLVTPDEFGDGNEQLVDNHVVLHLLLFPPQRPSMDCGPLPHHPQPLAGVQSEHVWNNEQQSLEHIVCDELSSSHPVEHHLHSHGAVSVTFTHFVHD